MLLSWLEERLGPKQFERLEKLRANLFEIIYVNVVFAFTAIIFWVIPLIFLIWIFSLIYPDAGPYYSPCEPHPFDGCE
jgi:hypothetical protein